MPEGDTILRAARALDEALAGRVVTVFDSPLAPVVTAARRLAVVGRKVESVAARGKHLLVRFEGGPVLHTHQGMHGSWHLYRSRLRWRRPAHRARAVIETADVVAVCFDSPRVELLSAAREREHTGLARLGPDVLGEGFDAPAVRPRLRAGGGLEIGVALVDQRALAGIGNVYKSEVLFLCGVSPFARVETLDDATLDRLVSTAARLMKRNVRAAVRRTSSALAPFDLWVYGRAGRPCRRCGTALARRTQGDPPRSTFWCPACQAPVPTTMHPGEIGRPRLPRRRDRPFGGLAPSLVQEAAWIPSSPTSATPLAACARARASPLSRCSRSPSASGPTPPSSAPSTPSSSSRCLIPIPGRSWP